MASLPERIRIDFPDGVSFSDLLRAICNETPATEAHLAEAVRSLCIEGELWKKGATGERRALSTRPYPGDHIEIARQKRFIFNLPSTKKPGG